jgi:hypothetical protein
MYLQKVISKKNLFLLASCQPSMKKAESGSLNQWYEFADPDPDPDPYQNVTSITLLPSIQPMSRICTVSQRLKSLLVISLSLSLFLFLLFLSICLCPLNSPHSPNYVCLSRLSPIFSPLLYLSLLLTVNLLDRVSLLSLSVTRHLSISGVPIFHLSSSVSRLSLRLSTVNPHLY